MSKIARIVQSQERYLDLVAQFRDAEASYRTFTEQHGTSEQRQARLKEIKNRLGGTIKAPVSAHPDPFDTRHHLRIEGRERHWTSVRGCPSCEQLMKDHGLGSIWSEAGELQQRNAEARELRQRVRNLWDRHQAVAEEHSREEGLLPSYYLRLDGSGRITATGSVRNFEVRGRLVLDEGTYVDYDVNGQTARAVFDSSEQLVAYHLGDGDWTVTEVGKRWEKYNSSQSYLTGKPQTDLYFGKKGEKGGHIAVNSDGNIEHVRDEDGEVLYKKYDPNDPYG